MNATLETVTKKKPEPTAEQAAAEELVRRAREQGLSLTGPDGLLKQLTKVVIETALDQEMTEHLGHEKNTPAGNETGNVRNGTRPKTVLTEGTGQVGDRGAPGPGRHVRAADRQEAAAAAERGRRDRAVAVCQGADDRGDQRALRRDLRRLGLEGDDLADHRPGDRGDAGLGRPGRWTRSTRRCSSTRSWSRSGTGRSPTGPSTRRSGSPWPGRRTSWACGPGPAGKVVGLPQVRFDRYLLLPEVIRVWCDLWYSW